MGSFVPIIRTALGLLGAAALLALALARRRKRTMTSLGLWAPAVAPHGSRPATTSHWS
jgi:hypothetical protein